MGRLSEQWTGLAHRLHFRSFHDTLVCRDLRMCIGIVCLNTEPVEVFHHIDFHPQILGVTEVHRFIIGILAFVQQPVFDRVLDLLIEQADHKLLGRLWKKFIT